MRKFLAHTQGASAVEFGLTAPVFFSLVFGLIDLALLMWVQLGLQHATEMAARCASVNKTVCANTASIKNYAATQVFGLTVAPAIFTVSTPACGSQVTASFDFGLIGGFYGTPVTTLNASACFPK